MWRSETPARVDVSDFSRSLGLSGQADGRQSQIWRMLRRLAEYRLATPVEGGRVGVFAQIGPLEGRALARLSPSTGRAHDELLGSHLEQLGRESAGGPSTERWAPPSEISRRLDSLERRPPMLTPELP
jgi:hypothetical protein